MRWEVLYREKMEGQSVRYRRTGKPKALIKALASLPIGRRAKIMLHNKKNKLDQAGLAGLLAQ